MHEESIKRRKKRELREKRIKKAKWLRYLKEKRIAEWFAGP